jgi:hypothetical protein
MTTTTDTIQAIPRTLVRNYLQAVRLPLTVAESVLKRGQDTEDWGPTMAFDALEATVLQKVGSFLKDEDLVTQGRLAEARVTQLRRAAALEAEAEAKRTEADAEYRERIETDEQRRKRIAAEADQRENAVAQEAARKKAAADAKARQQQEASRKIEAAQEKAISKQERAARRTRIEAEAEALADEQRAAAAEGAVLDLDAALRTTMAVRKAK